MRINQFIAHAGVCARRAAEKLIQQGKIKVNGRIVKDLHYDVQPDDWVTYQGKRLKPEKKYYILLHKPNKCVTTLHDPEGRPTVTQRLDLPSQVRVYPVGRLDYLTTGLLILTNDGVLANRLAHPSKEVIKTYKVTLDKALSVTHKDQIRQGIVLEDGFVPIDDLKMLGKKSLSIAIHIGRNRIIRRLFKHLGYHVTQLARTRYANLTLEGLEEGAWRLLTTQEVKRLQKMVIHKGKGEAMNRERT